MLRGNDLECPINFIIPNFFKRKIIENNKMDSMIIKNVTHNTSLFLNTCETITEDIADEINSVNNEKMIELRR